MLEKETLYSLNDVTIVPATTTRIEHRSECNVWEDGKLPLFTAPMSCVIDLINWETFNKAGIHTIIPRNVSIDQRIALMHTTWIAVGLEEFEQRIVNVDPMITGKFYVLVDIANGHMLKLLNLCKQAKEKYGDNLQLMAGNVTNPKIYREFAEAGIDYIRIGIGSGNVCTTSANSGCHYPMASLISEMIDEKEILKNSFEKLPKIVADGGFKNFDQINKALALGADYVMLGEIFAKTEEACGETTNAFADPTFWPEFHGNLARKYYGMSTRRAQKEFGGEGKKTSEGIEKWVPIDYTLDRWVNNFKHWLREAMSLADAATLEEFRTKTVLKLMSPQSYISYWK